MIWKHLRDLLTDVRFWLYLIAFLALGCALTFLPNTAKGQVGILFDQHIEPRLVEALRSIGFQDDAVPATQATTSPVIPRTNPSIKQIVRAIKDYVSPLPDRNILQDIKTGDVRVIASSITPIVLGSFAIAYLIVLLVPRATKLQEALQTPPPADMPPSLFAAATIKQNLSVNAELAELRLRARRGRLAVRYAVISGVLTVLVPPTSDPTVHRAALIAICVVLGAWAVAGFSRWPMPATGISSRTAFAGIFAGGLIALCITLPYQLSNGAASTPFTRDQLLMIIVLRLAILPAMAAVGAFVTVLIIRFTEDRKLGRVFF